MSPLWSERHILVLRIERNIMILPIKQDLILPRKQMLFIVHVNYLLADDSHDIM